LGHSDNKHHFGKVSECVMSQYSKEVLSELEKGRKHYGLFVEEGE
jgi:hypothetical protein